MGRKQKSGGFPERLVKRGLLSLAMAARMVHRRAYPQQYAIVEPVLTGEQLDTLAGLIASLAPVYTANYRSAQFRELTREELAVGVFRGGAQELAFPDSRAPIGHLAARVESATLVARKLREAKHQGGSEALAS